MQKVIATCLAYFLVINAGLAQKDGYKIKVTLKDTKDSMAYLAHYYGKPLPTIYKTDSARFDKNGVATFESKENTLGGIYMILLSDKKTYFEMLLNNGDNFSVSGSVNNLPDGLEFKNSAENVRFLEYVKFLSTYGTKQKALMEQLEKAKTAADTNAVRTKGGELSKELTNYRRDYVKKWPNTLLTNIFNALEIPQVPEGVHYLPDGKVDSNYAYNYYKGKYWEHFNFNDDRLINTPIYDMRLDEYMNKLVPPIEDTVTKEANILLAQARPSKELFKYTLWWLTRWAEASKVMGMDAVFVYLVENYYMKGDAFWLTPEDLQKYIDRAKSIAPNVIGNLGPDIKLPDVNNKDQQLSAVKAKYTLLIFWETDCGHCQAEIPKLDSLYDAVLKKKGVKVYAVRTDDDEKKWKETIAKYDLSDWINVYNNHTSKYRQDYDVYSTPTIYLLDEKKIIRGKRIDHSNIGSLIEMLEKKEKAEKQ
jgi:thiol-disulfide isomerase/thioredoxin